MRGILGLFSRTVRGRFGSAKISAPAASKEEFSFFFDSRLILWRCRGSGAANLLSRFPVGEFRSLAGLGIRRWQSSLGRKRGFRLDDYFGRRNHWRSWMPTSEGVVFSLIGANVAVFILWRTVNPRFMMENFTISLANFKDGRLHTLITSAFSHMDVDHILFNMIGLYFFGSNIGNLFGPRFLLNLYLAGAISGSIFFLLHKSLTSPSPTYVDMMLHSRSYALGASAAVNAILLLDVFLFPKNIYYLNFFIPVPAALMGAIIIGSDLLKMKKGDERVSGSAHLGGAMVAALVWARVKKGWI
ncbi:RHOMBOID-like protein 12, mitochondrial [Wolffia australiana]